MASQTSSKSGTKGAVQSSWLMSRARTHLSSKFAHTFHSVASSVVRTYILCTLHLVVVVKHYKNRCQHNLLESITVVKMRGIGNSRRKTKI